MRIKVNTHILGMKPGDIVEEGHKLYGDFKRWAVAKDTRNGSVICEICEPSAPEGVAEKEGVDDATTGAAGTNMPDQYVGDDIASNEQRKLALAKRARAANGLKK